MFQYKKTIALLSTAAFMAAFPLSSAASTQIQINSVSLDIDSDIEAGSSSSDVTVTTSSSKYSVEETTVTNTPNEEWEDGDKPKLKVYVEADDDYYFASGFSKSGVDISGTDGTITSVSRSNSSELIVYITLDELDGDSSSYDLDVSDLTWDESSGEAYWEEVEDANKYEVRLYRGSTAVTSVFTTTSSSYNFSSYLTSSGTYTFQVRGVYNSSNKGSWETSDSWYLTSSEAEEIKSSSSNTSDSSGSSSGPGTAQSTGAWLKDTNGWWYCNADKSYTVSNWQSIDGNWYYFNEYGYMVTGWVSWNSKWYYCGSDGAMYTNETTPDGYLVGSDGAWTGV